MKKLSMYAMLISLIISIMYSFKVYWMIDTELQFWRATAITLVSEIGLWCAYYYARDYESVKAHEENIQRVKEHYAQINRQLKDDVGNKPE